MRTSTHRIIAEEFVDKVRKYTNSSQFTYLKQFYLYLGSFKVENRSLSSNDCRIISKYHLCSLLYEKFSSQKIHSLRSRCVVLQLLPYFVVNGKESPRDKEGNTAGECPRYASSAYIQQHGFKKKTQAITEIWVRVVKAWAAVHSVTERQLGPHVVRRLNAQRYAGQVLRAKDFIAYCGSKRNHVDPTRHRLIEFMEH